MLIRLFLLLATNLYANNMYNTIKEIISQDPKLKSYTYKYEAQKHKYLQSKNQKLPTLTSNIQYGKEKYQYEYPTQTKKYNTTTKYYEIKLIQPIYKPQINVDIQTDSLKQKNIILEKKAYMQKLLAQVTSDYIDTVTFKAITKIYKNRLDNFEDMLNNVKEKEKIHFATKIELTKAIIQYEKAKNDYLRSKINYETLLSKITYQLKQNITIEAHINDLSNYIKQEIDKNNTIQNPNIEISKQNIKIAHNEIQKRKYTKYPSLDLIATYSDTYYSDDADRRNDFHIYLNLNIPILNFANNEYQKEATLLYSSSKLEYQNTLKTIDMKTSQMKYNIKQYLYILDKDKKIIQDTKSILQKQYLAYDNKIITLNELYTSENDFYYAHIQYLKDKSILCKNYINFLYIIGDLSLEKIKDLEKYLF